MATPLSSAAVLQSQRFLDPRVLARISDLQLVAKTVVQGFLTGLHRSPYQGVSIDFAEYRPYSPGDDPRSVDWNVYARTDRHYIKKYYGETNAELHIVLDSSASMGYRAPDRPAGTLSKFEYGCFLAASLAYFATHQRDAVGLLLFDTEIRESIPARARPGQLARILHALDRATPGKGTNLAGTLEAVAQFLRRRGLVVLISDLYETPEQLMRAVRMLQFGRNDVIIFHILDPTELEFDLATSAVLEDVETAERMEIVPEFVAPRYRQLLREHIEALRHECRTSRIDYELFDVRQPLDYALFSYLGSRQRRM
ncbi:MAG: DUF58 domain-containing protein [Acidobacteria bacterium]|nr:DUF58 domain-containing protein [Acidobacteriota bacterium]